MGASISKDENSTTQGNEFLHNAIKSGSIDDVRQLLDSKVSPDFLSSEGFSLLKICLDHDQLEIAHLLLASGVNIDTEDNNGRTILFHVIQSGRPEHLNFLLKYRPNVNHSDNNGWTPLHIAPAAENSEYFIRHLLGNGALVDSKNYNGITPLHTAIESRKPENVYEILKYRPNIKMMEYSNLFHTLIRLLYYGNPMEKVVDYLLDYGFVASEDDVKNNEFLRAAFSSQFYRLVEHLIQNGADIHYNFVGQPLFMVACQRRQTRLVKLMINKGIDVETKVNSLGTAIQMGDKDLLELLLNSGVPKDLGRLLPMSVRMGSAEILNSLLESEIPFFNVNSDFEGKTLAHMAAQNYDVNVIKVLWNHGADFQLKDADGNTPLHVACCSGFHSTVEVLLGVGADINALNNERRLPVDLLVDDFTHKPNALREHIAALHSAQMFVRDELLSFMNVSNDLGILEDYQREIEVMKKAKIYDTSVTFYRLLRSSEIEIANFLKNPRIKKELSSMEFVMLFPLYKDLLLSKIERGLRRKSLIDAVTESLVLQIPFLRGLPTNCIDYIMSTFSCEDLSIMNGTYRRRESF